jgi:plastocyanin
MPKQAKPVSPPKIHKASVGELLDVLKRKEYRYRYWAKRELREKNPKIAKREIDKWVEKLNPQDPRYRNHQLEAIWAYRNLELSNITLLKELLRCGNHNARAAAVKQLRYWYGETKEGNKLLEQAAKDPNGLVRMEAAIACSYIGTKEAFNILRQINELPNEKHLNYAIITALGSHKIRKFWDPKTVEINYPEIATFLNRNKRQEKEAEISKKNSKFDRQRNLLKLKIKCLKERMLFDLETFSAKKGQPIKLEFYNSDATPHNFVLVEPGSLEEIGQAANLMASDPVAAKTGQFIPDSKKIIVHTKMLNQEEKEILRFNAPNQPGEYPYMCTFPGHWIIMKGILVVK